MLVPLAGAFPRIRDWRRQCGVWRLNYGGSCICAGRVKGNGGTYSVSFTPDGKRFATGHGDGTVKVWDVSRLMQKKSD